MRFFRQNFYTLLLLFQLLPPAVRAQAVGTAANTRDTTIIRNLPAKDSLMISPAYAAALQTYHHFLTPEQSLYRGSEYVEYGALLTKDHPYFDNVNMQKGSVVYSDILYQPVLLQYDLVKDQLVINEPANFYKIALFSPQVGSFTIGTHRFIQVSDSIGADAPRAGFYEILYEGRTTLLKKEKKKLMEDLSSGILRYLVSEDVSYYLLKDARYYSINSKGALLSALKDKSKMAGQFIRKNKLSMRNDTENTILKVLAWYDSQNP